MNLIQEDMKKLYAIMMVFALALTGLSLTSCGEDNLDTNQYGKGVQLNVYGPQPVMRGGTLRFLGSNLDQVAQVKIPGVDPITNIEVVKSGVPSEIRVQVPKDGPEEGYVTLVTRSDEEITTITKLTYEEGVEVTSFAPETAMPGETLTIEGDYLNLVQMVEFADGVRVSQDDFISHDRYKIEVAVPEAARTGKLNLYTLDLTKPENDENSTAYNIIGTEKALTVGTPVVTKFASPRGEAEAAGTVTVKMNEEMTVTGDHFNLIDAIAFGDGENKVSLKTFATSEDGKTITFKLPATAPDGDVSLVCHSGVEVPVGKITTVAPSNCTASPQPVKAGAALTIKGVDLDVVNSVEMPNVSEEIAFTKGTDGKTLVISSVPETAQEGNLVLRMENGKGVEVPFTLVKPVVTGYNATSVNAGGALILNGTDLDLVKTIAFGTDPVEVKASADGKKIEVTVPMAATSGKPALNLANGTTVEAPQLTIQEAVFCYATTLPTEDNKPEAGSTLTISVKNGGKLTGVQVNGKAVQYVYDAKGSKLTISIPDDATATSTIKLISSNGEISYEIPVTPAGGPVETVIWTGNTHISWNAMDDLSWGKYDWSKVTAGTVLTVYYTLDADQAYWQLRIASADGWNKLPGFPQNEVGLNAGTTSYPYTLTQEDITTLASNNNSGLVITGANFTVTKLTLKK